MEQEQANNHQTTEESSFETLESLATLLSQRIIKYFIYVYTPSYDSADPLNLLGPRDTCFSQVRISLEKPSAVMFADAPMIEVVRTSDPTSDPDAKRLFNEWKLRIQKGNQLRRVPFPLQGTLSAWIEENSVPGDTV
jgi:hypothetical protein